MDASLAAPGPPGPGCSVRQPNENAGRGSKFSSWALVLVEGDHYTLFPEIQCERLLRTLRMPSGIDWLMDLGGFLGQGVLEEGAALYSLKGRELGVGYLGSVRLDAEGTEHPRRCASRLEVATLPGDGLRIRRTHFEISAKTDKRRRGQVSLEDLATY